MLNEYIFAIIYRVVHSVNIRLAKMVRNAERGGIH